MDGSLLAKTGCMQPITHAATAIQNESTIARIRVIEGVERIKITINFRETVRTGFMQSTRIGLSTTLTGLAGNRYPLASRPSMPSLPIMGTMMRAAIGSAHQNPKTAFNSNPTSKMADR